MTGCATTCPVPEPIFETKTVDVLVPVKQEIPAVLAEPLPRPELQGDSFGDYAKTIEEQGRVIRLYEGRLYDICTVADCGGKEKP